MGVRIKTVRRRTWCPNCQRFWTLDLCRRVRPFQGVYVFTCGECMAKRHMGQPGIRMQIGTWIAPERDPKAKEAEL
jgi:RNase P subunit RPR2